VSLTIPGTIAAAAEQAREIADDLLFPAAQEADVAAVVPSSNLDALRDAGLNGLQGPLDVPGGLGAGHAQARPVFEAIAGGCGATAFVWAQHHGAVRRVAGGEGPGRDRWLPQLCDGSALGGIGFAYLRRPGPSAVRATRDGDQWRLDGEAPWITGWGLIDVLIVMARAHDGSVVTVALDRLDDRPELRPGPRQALAVMRATSTVALAFDGVVVPATDVIGVQTEDAWSLRDAVGSAMPPAAPLGLAGRAIRLLDERGQAAGDARATVLAASLGDELERLRVDADRIASRLGDLLTDAGRASNELDAAIAAGASERDRGLAFARRATDALVAASGGGAMALSNPAQRLSREATFYLIQAQTGALRGETLDRIGDEKTRHIGP
jgi:alkylation response protein AidB-like acyl-CoA dehydrogenase